MAHARQGHRSNPRKLSSAGQACSRRLEPLSPAQGARDGQHQWQRRSYQGWMRYIREKGDVYLNVAKAPSFLAPGDPERSRLCIAMATCSDERESSARHWVVAAAGTRWGRQSSSCKCRGRSGQRGHHPKLRRGNQLVQREQEELEVCMTQGPHSRLTQGSASCPVLPAHQAGQGQQQRGRGLGGHQSLLSHSHHDAQGAASVHMRSGTRG